MAKKKDTDTAEQVEPGWDLNPLPPNEFKKQTLWSRTPIVDDCANTACRNGRESDDRTGGPDFCDAERVLCDGCFAELLREVRIRASMNEKLRNALLETNGR